MNTLDKLKEVFYAWKNYSLTIEDNDTYQKHRLMTEAAHCMFLLVLYEVMAEEFEWNGETKMNAMNGSLQDVDKIVYKLSGDYIRQVRKTK